MEVKIGKYDVLNSGNLIFNARDVVEIKIHESFILRITFSEDLTNPAKRIDTGLSEGKILSLKFINYSSSTNTSHTVPLPLGKFNGRKLYFNYAISHSRGGDIEIYFLSYVFMLGENV